MDKHIIKYQPEAFEWLFQDAQHAVLCIEQGGSQSPCKRCLKAIRDVIDREVK